MYETLKQMEPLLLAFNILLLPLHLKAYKRAGKERTGSSMIILKWVNALNLGLIEVIKYHRTMEEYFSLLQQTGFTITNIKEATPNQTYFQSTEEYERRLRIPLFLLFSCRK